MNSELHQLTFFREIKVHVIHLFVFTNFSTNYRESNVQFRDFHIDFTEVLLKIAKKKEANIPQF